MAEQPVVAVQDCPAATGAHLVAHNVRKIYESGSGQDVDALGPLNLTIGEGEFVSIVGPSGCGKSTFLRLAGGLDRATTGTISLGQASVDRPSPNVGIVFQSATLLPWLTILQNVMLPMRVGTGPGGGESAARELLATAGLEGFEQRYPYELSGGMQQRAAICRALIRDPEVLLLDEPFGALDALTRERMNVELQRIWLERRKTVLLITHSISEAVFLGDRIIVMSARPGRVLAEFRFNAPRPRSFESTTSDPGFIKTSREVRRLLDTNAGGVA